MWFFYEDDIHLMYFLILSLILSCDWENLLLDASYISVTTTVFIKILLGDMSLLKSKTSEGKVSQKVGDEARPVKNVFSLQAGQKFPPAGQISSSVGWFPLCISLFCSPNHKISLQQGASHFACFHHKMPACVLPTCQTYYCESCKRNITFM